MTHNHLLPNSIEILLPNVLDQINRFSDNSDFIAQMSLAFGNSWDYEKAKTLIKELAKGNSFPEIEIVSASQINGGKGAFDRSKNTIYLSEELLAGNTNNKEDVFLEELGHYIDSQINTTDSAGDEGAIFAAIVQGKTLSLAELSTLKTENDTTTAVIDGQAKILELSASYGNITLDGNLNDWTNFDRLDYVPGVGQPGFELYGKYAGDNYVFAIKSDSVAIGSETTIWLNTDRNTNTGYQIFGFAGGAEYNVNFFTDNQPYLYTGAAGENFVAGSLNYASDANNQVIEFAVPVSQLQGVTPGNAIDLLVDINLLLIQTYLREPISVKKLPLFSQKPRLTISLIKKLITSYSCRCNIKP
jgi:serralysin